MKAYFDAFGETTDVQIMVDPVTERSRGFGFVTFKDPNTVTTVLKDKPHTIDGKIVSFWGQPDPTSFLVFAPSRPHP